MQQVLSNNMNVREDNKALIVETLRSVAEIVIWGDQNDTAVFEYFLEKDMITYFDRVCDEISSHIRKFKCGCHTRVEDA